MPSFEFQSPALRWQFLHLTTLGTLAFVQPVLDLLAGYPEFFVARQTSSLEMIGFVVILWGGIAVVVLAFRSLAALAGRTAGRWTQAGLIGALGALVALSALQDSVLPWAVSGALALLAGAALSAGYLFSRVVAMFLSFLSPAILVVPAWFVFNPAISPLFAPGAGPSGTLQQVGRPVPIVMMVFDEFSLGALLDAGQRIDRRRFPHLAALAERATWYRGATTVATQTVFALPAMLSGRYVTTQTSTRATATEHPDNLLALLAPRYRLHVRESATALCPSSTCTGAGSTGRLAGLLADAVVLWAHRVVPRGLAHRLPDMRQNWGGFLDGAGATSARTQARQIEDRLLRTDRARQVERFIGDIRGKPRSTVHFLHVLLPHPPFEYLPSGKTYWNAGWTAPTIGLNGEFWRADPWAVDVGLQRYLLQLAFVDSLVGRLVQRLKDIGLYDEALLIITGDHGVSFQVRDSRRVLTQKNIHDLMQVPLLIKYPGQRRGALDDRNAETVDILPTVLDVIGADPWPPMDGVSLRGDSPRRAVKRIHDPNSRYVGPDGRRRKFVTLGAGREVRPPIVQAVARVFDASRGVEALYAPGPYRDLVGQAVEDFSVLPAEALTVRLEHPYLFRAADPAARTAAGHIEGRLQPADEAAHIDLAVTVNGFVRSVTRTYATARHRGRFSAFVAEKFFVPGYNDVSVFRILAGGSGAPRLQALSEADRPPQLVDGGRILVSPGGARRAVLRDRMTGHLDSLELQRGLAVFSGWAWDTARRRAVEAVALFADGQLAARAGAQAKRPDVAALWGDGALRSGFQLTVPEAVLAKARRWRLVTLLNDGRAAELKYFDGYPGVPTDNDR